MITLLTCSVIMSALSLLYMAAMPLLAKRYSEKGRYYAWLVIVVGLIIPFRPQFDSAFIKLDVPSETATPVIQAGNGTPVTVENAVLSPVSSGVSWWQVVMAVWLAGVITFFVYHAIKHYRFTKMAGRWSENITDKQTLTLLQSLKTETGISKQISLYLCSCIGSPTMIGFANPRILLPKADFAQDELRFILIHELIHYKRKDLWNKCLVLIATAIHWFNPIVYLAAKMIGVQCELSCDAEIVQSADMNMRQQYSETIISVVKYQSKIKTALSTNFFGGKKGMKKRIFSIMDMSKKKTGAVIICGVMIATLGTGFALAANASTGTPQVSSNTTAAAKENAYEESAEYEKYEEYGLTYDKETNNLYFKGELVRYFEDYYPLNENSTAGTDYFNENGIIDVYGVRDLSQLSLNPDGSTDPSGKLVGVEAYGQAEFDARDINELKNPQAYSTAVYGDGGNQEQQSGGQSIAYATSEGNALTPDELAELYAIYEPFGVTYNKSADSFYYNGKLVRILFDVMASNGEDLSGGEFSGTMRQLINDNGEIDIYAVRDYTQLDEDGYGKLIGIEVED